MKQKCNHQYEIVGTITWGESGDPQFIHKCVQCGDRRHELVRHIGGVVSPHAQPKAITEEDDVPWQH